MRERQVRREKGTEKRKKIQTPLSARELFSFNLNSATSLCYF